MVRRAIAERVIEMEQRFVRHGLKLRGITDSEDSSASDQVTK